MAKRLQFRGGTTTQHSTFTGANREITIDIDKHVPVVHDGVTPGGHPLAKKSDTVGLPTGLTDTQAKDAIYKAHSISSTASEIDEAVANIFEHVFLTKAEYDALTPIATTTYFITES